MPLISYPVDSAIQPLNNQSLGTTLAPKYRERCHGDYVISHVKYKINAEIWRQIWELFVTHDITVMNILDSIFKSRDVSINRSDLSFMNSIIACQNFLENLRHR